MSTTTTNTDGTVTALTTLATNLGALANSNSLVIMACSEVIDTTAIAGPFTSVTPLDVIVQGRIQVNTSSAPTAQSVIVVYIIPEVLDGSGGTFPLGVTTGSQFTFSTTDDRANASYVAQNVIVSSTATSAIYPIKPFSVAAVCMGQLPRRFCVAVSQNSQVALAAAGTHRVEYFPRTLLTT